MTPAATPINIMSFTADEHSVNGCWSLFPVSSFPPLLTMSFLTVHKASTVSVGIVQRHIQTTTTVNSVTPLPDQRDTQRAEQAFFYPRVSVTLMAALSSKDLSIYKTTADNIADGESASEMKAHPGPKFVITVLRGTGGTSKRLGEKKLYGKEIL